ncbi:P-loop containing nucleoside triphosphate hydrolase protein [Pleurotus eryngii]|uniref:RNA helicase n=1 Tax=Pleurotus eryngii TaxID=5323 RepID=A0A9P5ZHV2_PLEER|nr:P-loop containing nucleoside triphosphate hydrolase protein [Pleurotus eryngii]
MYKAHCSGRKHRSALRGSNAVYHCSVCGLNVSGNSWKSHTQGKRHRKNAEEQGISREVAKEAPVLDKLPGQTLCTICDQQVSDRLWSVHLSTWRHQRRSQFAAYQSVLAESEKDKHGIEIAGDFDFDIVEPSAAASGVAKSIAIRNTIPLSNMILVGSTLMSKKGKKYHSPFTAGTQPQVAIKFGSPVTISVTLRQAYHGTCDDRLEIRFKDVKLNKEFIVSRRLKAVIGNREELERLKPVAPYVPRQRTTRLVEREIVEGVFPPALKAIPYIGKLPLAEIPVFLPRRIDSETYGRFFKNLLWIEEHRMEQDLEIYDIPNATLIPHVPFYYLRVPGLAEKRPSVLVGDRILVQEQGAQNGHWFEGGVHKVLRDEVSLRFNASFKHTTGQTFHIHFKLNRFPLRRQHLTMDTAFTSDRILFPGNTHLLPQLPDPSLVFVNPLIGNNPAQRQAVASIVRQPPGSPPFVVFGPPGTGKTVTIIEAIRQIVARDPKARILTCAPSNSAADLIALRLTELGAEKVFRFYAPSRFKSQVPDGLLAFTHMRDDQHFSVPPIPILKKFRVIITTCVSASVVQGVGIPRGHYSHIFIDEAGQATEPESMISIKTIADNDTNIILSGDPKQLGPIIRSGIAREFELDTSYLERLMGGDIYQVHKNEQTVVKLTKNFRSHRAILKFPNDHFYGGELEECGTPKVINAYIGSSLLPSPKFPIIFHSMSGKDDREASSPSFFNIHEAVQVQTYVEALCSDKRIRITDNDIGVITPYHAQVLRIRRTLQAKADGVKVGSVEEFQGQERKVIIISTVRSSREFVEYDLRHTLGFVANSRRFNVAVTRSKALVVVVGDPEVLSLDPLWREFLNYVHTNGGWKGAPPSWDTSAPVDGAGGYDAQVRELAIADMNDFTQRMEELTLAGSANDENAEALDAGVDRPWREME